MPSPQNDSLWGRLRRRVTFHLDLTCLGNHLRRLNGVQKERELAGRVWFALHIHLAICVDGSTFEGHAHRMPRAMFIAPDGTGDPPHLKKGSTDTGSQKNLKK